MKHSVSTERSRYIGENPSDNTEDEEPIFPDSSCSDYEKEECTTCVSCSLARKNGRG